MTRQATVFVLHTRTRVQSSTTLFALKATVTGWQRAGEQAGQAMLESRRGQAPDNNDNSASTPPALTADERMRLEKSQGYDRGRYVRVERGDTLTALTADQVEFGATIAYNRLRYPNHIEVGQDLFIPERGTYNEEAAKQVANAYWKAKEARQQLQVKAQEASSGKTIANDPPIDPTDGMRAGPTRERAQWLSQLELNQARSTVDAYHRYLNSLDFSSGRLEEPPFAPDDLLGLGLFKGAAAISVAGFKKLEIGIVDNAELLISKALKGNPSTLRTNLIKAGITIPPGFAAHHLIESHMVNQFPNLFRSASIMKKVFTKRSRITLAQLLDT